MYMFIIDQICLKFQGKILTTSIVGFFLASLWGCDSHTSYPTEITINNLQKQYDEAKWIVYSSNYHKNGIYCSQDYKDSTVNIVACEAYLDTLVLNEDTTVMKFFFKKDNLQHCLPFQDFFINTIVFINNDTITYRFIEGTFFNNTVIEQQRQSYNSDSTHYEWAGVFPPLKEQKMFRDFMWNYKGTLDPWLKKEAIRRGMLQ